MPFGRKRGRRSQRTAVRVRGHAAPASRSEPLSKLPAWSHPEIMALPMRRRQAVGAAVGAHRFLLMGLDAERRARVGGTEQNETSGLVLWIVPPRLGLIDPS